MRRSSEPRGRGSFESGPRSPLYGVTATETPFFAFRRRAGTPGTESGKSFPLLHQETSLKPMQGIRRRLAPRRAVVSVPPWPGRTHDGPKRERSLPLRQLVPTASTSAEAPPSTLSRQVFRRFLRKRLWLRAPLTEPGKAWIPAPLRRWSSEGETSAPSESGAKAGYRTGGIPGEPFPVVDLDSQDRRENLGKRGGSEI